MPSLQWVGRGVLPFLDATRFEPTSVARQPKTRQAFGGAAICTFNTAPCATRSRASVASPSARSRAEHSASAWNDQDHLRACTLHNRFGFCLGLMRLVDLLLRCGERPAGLVNPRHSIHLFEEQVSLRYVKVPHDKLQSTALVLIHEHSLCNGISDESLGTASCLLYLYVTGGRLQNSGRAKKGKSMANPRVSEDG